MLCPSCRRQLERGASFCGSCGTPLNGGVGAARAGAGRRDADPGRLGDDDRARARGVAGAQRPVGVARARADHGRRGAGGRRLEPRHVAGRRARDRPVAAARRGEDPARRRRAAGRAPARGGRGRADDRGPRRGVAARPVGRPAGGRLDAVRDAPAGALGLRAQAARRVRGAQALGAEGSADRRRSCGSRTTTRSCSNCSTARTRWSSWSASSSSASAPTGPARLARLLTDLGERGFLHGVAGGQPLAEEPTGRLTAAVQAAREDVQRASGR